MTSQCLNLLFVCIGLSLTFPLLILNHLFHLSCCLTLLLCELLLQLLYRRALRLHLLLQRSTPRVTLRHLLRQLRLRSLLLFQQFAQMKTVGVQRSPDFLLLCQ